MDFANKNIKLYSCAVGIKITSVINVFGKPVKHLQQSAQAFTSQFIRLFRATSLKQINK